MWSVRPTCWDLGLVQTFLLSNYLSTTSPVNCLIRVLHCEWSASLFSDDSLFPRLSLLMAYVGSYWKGWKLLSPLGWGYFGLEVTLRKSYSLETWISWLAYCEPLSDTTFNSIPSLLYTFFVSSYISLISCPVQLLYLKISVVVL